MEVRTVKMMISKPGGNASAGSLNYRVTIPNTWAKALKITPEDRELQLSFDGEKIIIERKKENEK